MHSTCPQSAACEVSARPLLGEGRGQRGFTVAPVGKEVMSGLGEEVHGSHHVWKKRKGHLDREGSLEAGEQDGGAFQRGRGASLRLSPRALAPSSMLPGPLSFSVKPLVHFHAGCFQ